jgi:hypothetical protein
VRPQHLGEQQPDTARRRVHQSRLPSTYGMTVLGEHMDREPLQQHCRRLFGAHAFGHPDDAVGGQYHLLGVGAGCRHVGRGHQVTDREAGDAGAHGGDGPRQLTPGDVGQLAWVEAASFVGLVIVDADGGDVDEYIAGTGDRCRPFRRPQYLGTAMLVDRDRAHCGFLSGIGAGA